MARKVLQVKVTQRAPTLDGLPDHVDVMDVRVGWCRVGEMSPEQTAEQTARNDGRVVLIARN